MPVYLIATFTVDDEVKYAAYGAAVRPLAARHGGTLLASDRAARPLEGSPGSTAVIVSFPGSAEATAFWDDPDYQPVKAVRLAATNNGVALFATGLGV